MSFVGCGAAYMIFATLPSRHITHIFKKMPALAWSVTVCGAGLCEYHRAAANKLLRDPSLVGTELSSPCIRKLLANADLRLVLVWWAGRCVASALFRPDADCAQLILLACATDAHRLGLGRALVSLVRHACCHASSGDPTCPNQQLYMVAPRNLSPGVRKFLRACDFVGVREQPRDAVHPWKEATELCTYACALSKDDRSANLPALLSAAQLSSSGASSSAGAEEEAEEGDDDDEEASPRVGSVVALFLGLDQQYHPVVVTERTRVMAERGSVRASHSLRVSYLQGSGAAAAPPPLTEERAVEGWKLKLRPQPSSAADTSREAAALPRNKRPWYFLAVPPASADWRRYLSDALQTGGGGQPADSHSVPKAFARAPSAADAKAAAAPAGSGVGAAAGAATGAAAAPSGRGKAKAELKFKLKEDRPPLHAARSNGAACSSQMPPPPPKVPRRQQQQQQQQEEEPESHAQVQQPRPPDSGMGGGAGMASKKPKPSIPRNPIKVDYSRTPPMPPTPESPARPSWWRDGEDDERAAEMLYTLFSGDTGAGLARDLDEWVLRETPIASEAFPHVDFWRGLDIRWVQYSCAHAGVGEALRELKAAFARGEGRLRHVSVDGGRQKRSRRGNGEEEANPRQGRELLQDLDSHS